jgi:hypothetical protein
MKKFKNIFIERIKNDTLIFYLTGGAMWAMMNDDTISLEKDFIPEDELNIERLGKSSIYKVFPFSNALDSFNMINVIQ